MLFEQTKRQVPSSLLKDRYGWPPFSILNTISHDWQRRVDEWNVLIGDSSQGRDLKRYNATPVNTFSSRGGSAKQAESVSKFDPYLTELMVRWFSRPGDKILDPFAGGCTRGVVSAILGRDYTGIDLSPKQVGANNETFETVSEKYNNITGASTWIEGNSFEILPMLQPEYNMVLTCPPYYNLEKYTDDPRDLSNMSDDEFEYYYTQILLNASKLLVPDSFFVIVVSEVRADSLNIAKSYYRGLVPKTINFAVNGCFLHYYNEIILENNIGSLPMRAPKYFDKTRKIGRHHQNILVFYKGDITHIESKFGPI